MAAQLPQALGGMFDELLFAKQEKDAAALQQAFMAGAVKILELKEAHRVMCEATEALRQGNVDDKTHLDQSSLQLQNLLYEKHHYEREIASCTSFRSAFPDEQLELVPVEAFLADPAAPDTPADDAHTLTLNRLEHELALRQAKLKDLDALKARRDALAADVARRRSALSGLEGDISRLRASAQRTQRQYGSTAPSADGAPIGSPPAL